jgi:hypothetical protein
MTLKMEGELRIEKFYRIEDLMVDQDDVQKWRRYRGEVRENEIISILRGGRAEFEGSLIDSVNG